MSIEFWFWYVAHAQLNLADVVKIDAIFWYEGIKRFVFDIGLTAVLLALTSPLMLVIALLIKLDGGGPVIHQRLVQGKGGRAFHAYKFRTMYVNGDEILARYPLLAKQLQLEYKLHCDPRVTRVGKWLRRSSLDELPQLFNILWGHMSLVGPRMVTAEEVKMYGAYGQKLLTVLPGLSGWWQVNGRSTTTYKQRIALDMYYIDNQNLWLDVQILWRTIWVVLWQKGAF